MSGGHARSERLLLAIDTSTEQNGLALFDGERLAELSLPGGRQQTTHVLTQIDWLVRQFGASVREIDTVAVAIGPGSFTGLRVGLSVAKGLTVAQAARIIGVPTLDVVVRPFAGTGIDLVAVIPAGRSRYVWAITQDGVVGEPVNSTLDELIGGVRDAGDVLVTGEVPASAVAALHEAGIRAHPAIRQPGALAVMGWERRHAGLFDDPIRLEPIYLHGAPTPQPPRSQR